MSKPRASWTFRTFDTHLQHCHVPLWAAIKLQLWEGHKIAAVIHSVFTDGTKCFYFMQKLWGWLGVVVFLGGVKVIIAQKMIVTYLALLYLFLNWNTFIYHVLLTLWSVVWNQTQELLLQLIRKIQLPVQWKQSFIFQVHEIYPSFITTMHRLHFQ